MSKRRNKSPKSGSSKKPKAPVADSQPRVFQEETRVRETAGRADVQASAGSSSSGDSFAKGSPVRRAALIAAVVVAAIAIAGYSVWRGIEGSAPSASTSGD